MTIAEELALVPRRADGSLHAEDVVSWAKDHRDTDTWKQLNIGANAALQEHYLNRARHLIRAYVRIEPRKDRRITANVVKAERLVSLGGINGKKGYRTKASLRSDNDAYERAISELRSTHERLGMIRKLKPVWDAITAALEEFDAAQEDAA